MSETSEAYEVAARQIIGDMLKEFGLGSIEGKQDVQGTQSGTTWEIDSKGVVESGEGFLIIECRRYTTSAVKQEAMGALAYRIQDTGAAGGILVSPLPVQEGAAKVAKAENIISVQLNAEATRTEYLLQFFKQIFAGIEERVSASDSMTMEVIRAADGKVVSRHEC